MSFLSTHLLILVRTLIFLPISPMMKKEYILILLGLLLAAHLAAQTRDCDPVVVEGSEVSCMLGVMPNDVVAFKYQNNTWQQIPMQIDERQWMDVNTPYGPSNCLYKSTEDVEWDILYYTDPNTFIGADVSDPSFDVDDELAFMAKDVGGIAPHSACPAGVFSNTKCQLLVNDPLFNNVLGYIYLFEQDGSLAQDAGEDYVDYDYDDFGGDYKGTYLICAFSGDFNNPEVSKVTTDRYSMNFTQRWVNDELKITAGNASGIDILDQWQYFTNINACARNEETFSNGKGGIIAYKEGPIRGIRSVMGANSGTFTQLDIIFTACRTVSSLYYRMHPGVGFYDVLDLNTDAFGMQFYSDQNPMGVTIDGEGDLTNNTNPSEWELIVGAQGAIVSSYVYSTDMTLGTPQQLENGLVEGSVSAFYNDTGGANGRRCTGDERLYGASGFHIQTAECTDNRYDFANYPQCMPDEVRYFSETRTQYYLAPQTTTGEAINYANFAKNPLTVSAVAQNCMAAAPTCTDGIQNGNEEGVDCGGSCAACPSNNDCPDEFVGTLPTTSGTYNYLNTNSIQSDATVTANTEVVFEAESYIQLLPGFHAVAGSSLTARIADCTLNNVAEVTSRSLPKMASLKVIPNPVINRQLRFQLFLPQTTDAYLQLYNANGQRIGNVQWRRDLERGNHLLSYDLSNVSAGLYFLEVQVGEKRLVEKVVITD